MGKFLLCCVLTLALTDGYVLAQRRSPFDAAPIHYNEAQVDDPVFRLQRELDAGNKKLHYDAGHGYLASVLKLLNVPASSQVLVFSRTSFQRPLISREKPRAVYFSDDVYIGWVQQGDVLEISAVDPDLGAIFYTVDQQREEQPIFERRIESCMLCHSSSVGSRVPGHLVRSIHANPHGSPIPGLRSYRTSHNSPFSERWGGWYVSGTHGGQYHMGNQHFSSKEEVSNPLPSPGQNVTDLSTYFDTAPYLSADSDIVALLVLEHQVRMHNLLTAACYETKRALADESLVSAEATNQHHALSPVTNLRINKAAEQVVDYMLFCDEVELTSQVKGTSTFQTDFPMRGPRDDKDRSLRDFDLQTRIFRYPCSYLIYSESFTSLPDVLKDRVVERLHAVLSGKDDSDRYQHLSPTDRVSILEILRSTHDSFAML